MSSKAVLGLHAPLKEFVLASVHEGSPDFGATEKDQAQVESWLERVAQGDVAKSDNLKSLDSELTPRTFVVGNALTAADVALYGALHPVLSQLQPTQYFAHPAVTRYVDHIQTRPSVREAAAKLAPAFAPIIIELTNAPKIERVPDAPKPKKEKAAAASATPAARAVSSAEPATAPPEGEKATKKDKKEKKKDTAAATGEVPKKGAGAPAAKGAADDAGEPVPSMIDLRVGHIVDVKKHPDADGLYVEQIDFGEAEGPRTVVSGLVNYIPIENMRDKMLVGVCNLKPASMRGVKSFAMVLCATSKDGKEAGIELIQPPPGSKPGDRVYFDGPAFADATPLSQLNPKKKIFETIQPGFTTLESREAAWVDPVSGSVHHIRTAAGICVAPTLVGASLS